MFVSPYISNKNSHFREHEHFIVNKVIVTSIYLQSPSGLSVLALTGFVSFVAFINGVSGVCAYLLGRREAGFLNAFVTNSIAQIRYVTAQLISGFIFGVVLTIIYCLILAMLYKIEFQQLIIWIIRSTIMIGIASMLGCALNLLPYKFEIVLGVLNLLFIIFILLTLAESGRFNHIEYIYGINYFNPVALGMRYIQSGKINLLYYLAPLSVISIIVTIRYFSIKTYWDA